MKRRMAALLMAGGMIMAWPICVWAEPEAEQQQIINDWEYRAEGNVWYYHGRDGQVVTGRQDINGDVYFFDEEGKMLTGWVSSGEDKGDEAERCSSADIDDTVFLCDSTGRMVRNRWMAAFAPDSLYFEGAVDLVQEDNEEEDQEHWYYFDAKGHAFRNEKVEYDGEFYIFDEEGRRLNGWVYVDERSGETQYVKVTDETDEAQSGDIHHDGTYAENFYAHNPQNYLFCDWNSGKVVKNSWITTTPPGKDEDEDARSFYCGKNGYIVTQYRHGFQREEGDWNYHSEELNREIVADKLWLEKIENENIGTYAYNGTEASGKDGDGYEGFIFKAEDGRFYLCENNGARIDGLFLIRKKEESTKQNFPNGFYDFSDHSAMVTGAWIKNNEYGDSFFYYFSDKSNHTDYKGRGVTGVYGGKLYYQGLAVGSDDSNYYQLVYVPELANKNSDATGLFLVDAEGTVMTGSASRINAKGIETGGRKYNDSGSSIAYRVCKPKRGDGKYGYDIYRIDKDDDDEDDVNNEYNKQGVLLGADDAVCMYIKEVEE